MIRSRPLTARRHARSRRFALLVVLTMVVAGCASFPSNGVALSAPPSLTPNIVTIVPPSRPLPPQQPDGSSSPDTPTDPDTSTDPKPNTATKRTPPTTVDADRCSPPQLPVVAVCLDSPVGLAPLPGGHAALVGERTSGRVSMVAPNTPPTTIATVDDIDTAAGGGLLGIALSPYYHEDALVYAYATTATDQRVLRFAAGQPPKAVVTGIATPSISDGKTATPGETVSTGGALLFGPDALLYITTPHEIWRVDGFGDPAPDNQSGTALFATGLTDPTGLCLLPDDTIGVIDHRGGGDVLLSIDNGADYTHLGEGAAWWTFAVGDGGAIDCAISDQFLLASARGKSQITRIEMRDGGGFTGSPDAIVAGEYGQIATLAPGASGLVWATTANRHRSDHPAGSNASDDRVLLLPPDTVTGGGIGAD